MKQLAQNKLIGELEMQVEQHLHTATRVFQNMPEHRLLAQAAPGKWSVAQCLWHLNSYGDFYFPLIGKALEKNASAKPFRPGWFGNYFVNMMNPASGKRYRAFHAHTPPQQPDAYATVAGFINQQEQLLGFVRSASGADLSVRLPVSISSLVRLKLGDVLRFIVIHNERHMQQALKCMHEQEQKPAGA